MKWFALLVALPLMVISGCSTPEQRAAESSRSSVSSAEEAAAKSSIIADIMDSIDRANDVEIPEGYVDIGNGLAVKWIKKGQDGSFTCKYYDRCTNLKIFSYRGCPSGVYGAVNIKDPSGTVVDWTNASLPSLPQGQYGVLVFNTGGTSTSGRLSTELADLTCR